MKSKYEFFDKDFDKAKKKETKKIIDFTKEAGDRLLRFQCNYGKCLTPKQKKEIEKTLYPELKKISEMLNKYFPYRETRCAGNFILVSIKKEI